MPVDAYGPDVWMVTHAGFSRNPADYEYEPFQMSYEFATFLKKWDLGDFGPSEFHSRNFFIARRKGCFPLPLMNGLGVFTEEGQKLLAKARSYIEQICRYYESIGFSRSEVPQWYDSHRMDTIVLGAPIMSRHIAFLKNLYNVTYPESPGANPTQFGSIMPGDPAFVHKEFNGKQYMLTGALRPNPRRRQDLEVLLKFGLVGFDLLPKPVEAHGRGRAPVGAFLTEMGRRFFEDFQARYDPQVKKMEELRRMMQEP